MSAAGHVGNHLLRAEQAAVADPLEAAVGAVGLPQPAEPVVAHGGLDPVRVGGAQRHAQPGVGVDQRPVTGRVDHGGGVQPVGIVFVRVLATLARVVGPGDRGDVADSARTRRWW